MRAALNSPAVFEELGVPATVRIAQLTYEQRRRVYYRLRLNRMAIIAPQLRRARQKYNDEVERAQARLRDAEKEVLDTAWIVGATTTGLAKYMSVVQRLNVDVVIVEEAAELSEAQVLACIPTARRLVMIGDHQQLRPKVNCYELEKKYALNISLMERLINNRDIDFVTLDMQRRMRPEISGYTKPLYQHRCQIIDHASTQVHGPAVAGFSSCVQFIEHDEAESSDGDSHSHANIAEARFVCFLAKYLAAQGTYVPPSKEIVIIAPYVAQTLHIRRLLSQLFPITPSASSAAASSIAANNNNNKNKKVSVEAELSRREHVPRVVTLDDFQGEEADIIILCLVRSSKPGFLRAENRVTVALSRARKGMFVVGNFACFREAQDTVWPRMLAHAEQQGHLHRAAQLRCLRHGACWPVAVHEALTGNRGLLGALSAATSKYGGCPGNRTCGARRECGHTCAEVCHGGPCEIFPCTQPCTKNKAGCRIVEQTARASDLPDAAAVCVPESHKCKKRCCDPCSECGEIVMKDFACKHSHSALAKCCVDESKAENCFVKITIPHPRCTEKKKHPVEQPCSVIETEWQNVNLIPACQARCGGQCFGCKHNCEATCCECPKFPVLETKSATTTTSTTIPSRRLLVVLEKPSKQQRRRRLQLTLSAAPSSQQRRQQRGGGGSSSATATASSFYSCAVPRQLQSCVRGLPVAASVHGAMLGHVPALPKSVRNDVRPQRLQQALRRPMCDVHGGLRQHL